MLWYLNPKLWLAGILLAALTAGAWKIHNNIYNAGLHEAQLTCQADKQALENQHAKDIADAQAAADQIALAKDAKVRTLNTQLANALASLRKRADRPAAASSVPTSAAPATSCTGAELYRPDAEFLIGEAARADKLRLDLIECQPVTQ